MVQSDRASIGNVVKNSVRQLSYIYTLVVLKRYHTQNVEYRLDSSLWTNYQKSRSPWVLAKSQKEKLLPLSAPREVSTSSLVYPIPDMYCLCSFHFAIKSREFFHNQTFFCLKFWQRAFFFRPFLSELPKCLSLFHFKNIKELALISIAHNERCSWRLSCSIHWVICFNTLLKARQNEIKIWKWISYWKTLQHRSKAVAKTKFSTIRKGVGRSGKIFRKLFGLK